MSSSLAPTGVYKRNKNMRIQNAFEEFYCLRSNPSNDDIISALRPGLKTGIDFRGLFGKWVWKIPTETLCDLLRHDSHHE